MKTKKAMKGRFKVTATGKLLKHSQGRRHLLSKKTSERKRRLGRAQLVPKEYMKKYASLMGV